MNGIENPIVFYPASVLMVVSAIFALKFHNIFYSLLCAIITFLCAGMFFYVLGSEYNAVIQVLIYVIAVPVILGVAIMFTDFRSGGGKLSGGKSIEDKSDRCKNNDYRFRSLKNVMFLTSGVFVLAIIYLTLTSFVFVPDGFNYSGTLPENPRAAFDAISAGIFGRYVYAFEIISIILTIVVVGISLFKKEGTK